MGDVAIDMTGKKFGRWVVLDRAHHVQDHRAFWLCECECGNRSAVLGSALRRGVSQSCGCLRTEKIAAAHLKREKIKPDPLTYESWKHMKQRCCNPNHKSYRDYGQRGISVSDRWLNSFANFLADMGKRPPGTTLDRIDNNLGYFKANCRWATKIEQNRNRRPQKKRFSIAG